MKTLEVLHQNRRVLNAQEALVFAQALAEIAEERSAALLPDPPRVFDDGAVDDALLFQLIHYLESFSAAVQLRAMIEALVDMQEHAPQWTKVLHYRLLNDPHSVVVYRDLLAAATPPAREVAQRILRAIAAEETGQLKSQAEFLLSV